MNGPFPLRDQARPSPSVLISRLDAAKKEILEAIRRLRDCDVCLIAFSDLPTVVCEAPCSGIAAFEDAIEPLTASGNTNLAAGLRLVLQRAESSSASILVVSDGFLSDAGDTVDAARACGLRREGEIPITVVLIGKQPHEADPLFSDLKSLAHVSVHEVASSEQLASSVVLGLSAAEPTLAAKGQVFLSYASADRTFAEMVKQRLRLHRAPIWMDDCELAPGDSLRSRIDDALSATDYVVVLLSSHSVSSNWVRYELNGSLLRDMANRAVTLLPVLIDNCEIPSHLSSIQYLDLRTDPELGVDELALMLEETARIDFSQLDAYQFEQLVADLFSELGFRTEVSDRVGDGGADIVAIRPATDPFGTAQAQQWLVQVKRYGHRRADLKSVHDLVTQLEPSSENKVGVIATTGQFTSAVLDWTAHQVQRGVPLHLLDGVAIKRLLLRHPDVVERHFKRADEPGH
jgi:hypothetical protein